MIRLHSLKLWLLKQRDFGLLLWEKHGERIVLGVGIFLIAVLSFEAGYIQKSLAQPPKPVIVRMDEGAAAKSASSGGVAQSGAAASQTANAEPEATQCAFVGSKKSNKYHLPTSRCAKQIKPANRICFASREAAEARQYLPGCLEP